MEKKDRERFKKAAQVMGYELEKKIKRIVDNDNELKKIKEENIRIIQSRTEHYLAELMKDKCKNKSIVVVTMNYFVKPQNDDTDPFPCEISFAKYRFGEGIEKLENIHIKHSSLSKGSYNEALLWSEETHRMPLPPKETPESIPFDDFEKKVKNFLQKECFVFAFLENKLDEDALYKVLTRCQNNIVVVPLQKCIYNKTRKKSTTEDDVYEKLKHDIKFNFYNIKAKGCEFHEAIDNAYNCTMAK
jgi:hypothetical protein